MKKNDADENNNCTKHQESEEEVKKNTYKSPF